jgi:hypothetical protein
LTSYNYTPSLLYNSSHKHTISSFSTQRKTSYEKRSTKIPSLKLWNDRSRTAALVSPHSRQSPFHFIEQFRTTNNFLAPWAGTQHARLTSFLEGLSFPTLSGPAAQHHMNGERHWQYHETTHQLSYCPLFNHSVVPAERMQYCSCDYRICLGSTNGLAHSPGEHDPTQSLSPVLATYYDGAFIQLLAQTIGISETELAPAPLFSCTPHSPCLSPTPSH